MRFLPVRSPVPVFLLAASLSGCVESPPAGVEDIDRWMQEASVDLKGRVPPLPEIRQVQTVAYTAQDLADPFDPARMSPQSARQEKAGMQGPDTTRPKEPLERFALEELRFSGILRKNKEVRALIDAPDGTVYSVSVGSYLGRNFGRVVGIEDDKVRIEEMVQDSEQRWVKRPAELNLEEKP